MSPAEVRGHNGPKCSKGAQNLLREASNSHSVAVRVERASLKLAFISDAASKLETCRFAKCRSHMLHGFHSEGCRYNQPKMHMGIHMAQLLLRSG